jgi:hypothetical protein
MKLYILIWTVFLTALLLMAGYVYWAVGNITDRDIINAKNARIRQLELYGN